MHGPGRTSLLCRRGVEEDVAAAAPVTLAARQFFCWNLRRRGGVFTFESLSHQNWAVTLMDLLRKVWLPPSTPFGGPDLLNGLKKIPSAALSCR